jgi:DNA-binding NtrC family response regulator
MAVQGLFHKGERNAMKPDGFADSYSNTPIGAEGCNLKELGRKAAEIAEKEAIQIVLRETHWNRKEAAKILHVSYKALLYKIRKYLLDERKQPLDRNNDYENWEQQQY